MTNPSRTLDNAMADAPVDVAVELARVRLAASEVESLHRGDVIDLGLAPGSLVDIRIGDVRIGAGELVEIEGQIGIRVVELTTAEGSE